MLETLVRQAIGERRLIEFRLHGLLRIAEPHLYGLHKGVPQLLVYQVGGESKSGGLPHWRRIGLQDVSGLKILEENFRGSRRPAQRPAGWDKILVLVE